MSKSIFSYDEVFEYHGFFVDTFCKHNDELPEFLNHQAEELKNRFALFSSIHYDRKKSNVTVHSSIDEKNWWKEKADVLLRKAFYLAKAEGGEKVVKEFFGSGTPSNTKKPIDKLILIDQLLSVAAHPERAELNSCKSELEAMSSEGRALLETHNQTTITTKHNTQTVQEARDHWALQYNRMKLYMKAFYLDSHIDYEIFFKDLKKPAKKEHRGIEIPETTHTK